MPRGRTPGPPQPSPQAAALVAAGIDPDLAMLAARIGSLRVRNGWTRQQLSDHSGVNNKQITEIEEGVRNPSFSTIVRLARALGLASVDELFAVVP